MSNQYIYVVLPTTVEHRGKIIKQKIGRNVAQACHAVSRVRCPLAHDGRYVSNTSAEAEPLTTIVLRAKDSEHLSRIIKGLRHEGVEFEQFYDTNSAVYGSGRVRTAIATYPMAPGSSETLSKLRLY